MLFMIIYYRLAGVIANISLIVSAFVMLGAIAAFDVTLTLPGIAGIVLTIGMAVDANVLIYERIREELQNGKSLASSVSIGFNNAFSAIFDSNMTTLFVALILFWQGSGAIKSFAITLAIGIFTTLFTAVFLTRILFDLLLKACGNRLKTLSMLQFCKNPKIDFLSMKKITIGLSVILVVGSLVLIGVRNKDILGIDFTGGSQLIVSYQPKTETATRVEVSAIENYLKDNGYNARASYKTTEDNVEQLEIVLRGEVDKNTGTTIIDNMDKFYPDVKFEIKAQNQLGALIGAEFTKSAIIALVLAMIGMIIYMIIRFQLSYSIAANIALIHDVLVSLGIYLAFGGQLTLNVVASLLTLIGYSVNDTIVTFDRQRENLTLMRGASYKDIVNTSINQTLGRTILTSTSVLLILVSQIIWGGEGIRDFISVMLIGCIVGCYSSIFISPTITAYWHKRERNVSEEVKSVES
ncbi:MAG: protein translocase subunit SecF [Lentisphaeria bacterium]|nr:protein translocase subunit SecF [Lentisphaeria bacterium]